MIFYSDFYYLWHIKVTIKIKNYEQSIFKQNRNYKLRH